MYLIFILILLTCIISYKGVKQEPFLQQYAFNIERIQTGREYIRLISSGFLHVSWLHLVINMIVLYAFGSGLALVKGDIAFMIIYFTALIGGNLVALQIHKHKPNYTSVGASGAISGIVFATIGLFPYTKLLFLPGWVFGILYVGLTLYAIRSQRTDVGHAAHIGGALTGMGITLMMFPDDLAANWIPAAAVLVPASVLLFLLIRYPDKILIHKKTRKAQLSDDDRYNIGRSHIQQETDRILEKINKQGINSLTEKERKFLEEQSQN